MCACASFCCTSSTTTGPFLHANHFLQYNIYLRNVNKVLLFRRVVDRQTVKRVGRVGPRAGLEALRW